MSKHQQQHNKQQTGNNFSVLTVDPSIEDDSSSTRKASMNQMISFPSSLSPQQEVLKSIRLILRLDKSKLIDQLNSMMDNFKKVLHQLLNIGQVRKENIEFYCEWMRMIKHLCIGGGDKVSFRLGNETDIIPWLLYIAFDANVVNEQFIDGEIVRLACTTIHALIDNVDENRIIVRESRGLKNFLDLIRVNQQSFAVNSECKRCALLVLEKFCINSSNKSLFPIINGTQIVIDQMNQAYNTIMNSPKKQIDVVLYGIIEACSRVLRSLCLNHQKNTDDISSKTPIAPLILCILNSLNVSMSGGKNEKSTSSSEGYKTLKVQDNDFSELLSHILFILLAISQKENRKTELIEIHSTLKEENQFLELLLSLVCYLYSSSSSSGSNYTRKAFNQTLSILANLSSIEKVRKELISQKEGKSNSSKYFNYYLDKKYLNGAQVIHVQFTRFGTLKTSQNIEEQEERSFAESVLSLFTHIGEYNFKDLYLFIGMKVTEVLNHVYTIINHTNDIIILQHCLYLIRMYLSQENRSIVEGVTNDHLTKAAECILSILNREFIINQSFTSTLHLKSQYHSDVELANLQYSCLTTFNSLNLQDVGIWRALIEKAQKSIHYHRLCDWIIQMELVEKNSRVLLAILEILNQMVQYEKVDIRDIALLGIGSKIIKLLDHEMFQDIAIYLIYSLSLDSIFKQTFIFGGGLKKLFKLAKINEATFLNNVLKIFTNFSRKDRNAKVAIAETGCLDYILNRFSTDKTYTNKNIKNTVALLQSLSEVPTLATFIASFDIVPNLVKLLTSSESCAILEQATNLIFSVITIAKYEQGRKRVIEHFKDLIPFLHCEIPEAQENVINIFSNIAAIPQHQKALKEGGLVTELENLVEGDDQYISLLAQLALNNFSGKKGEESLKNKLLTAANKSEDFKAKKESIEKQYVKKYENEIKRESVMWNSLSSSLNTNAYEKLNIEINWSFFDELSSEAEKRRAFHLLKETSWRNLRESISLFCNQSPVHNRTFLTCVNILVVEFEMTSYLAYKPILGNMNADFAELPMSARSNRKTCATLKNISTSESVAETYKRKYNKLGVLFYNIGYDDMNTMSKEDFVAGLNRLLQEDISKIREITPKSVLETDSLKFRPFKKEIQKEDQKVHSRNNSLNDLGLAPMNLTDDQMLLAKNPMLFLKEQARQTYKGSLYLQSFATLIKTKYFTQYTEDDEKAFAFCFEKIKAIEETFIKGWKVVKYNKSGLKQERFILLTDKNYYTIKFDYSKKHVDTKHTKPHDLSNIHVIDIGCFEKTSSPCLVVYCKEKTSKSKKSFAKTAKKSFKLSSTADLSLATLDHEIVIDKNRPSTLDCYCNIFCGLNESNSSTSVSSNTPTSAPSAADLLSFNTLGNQVQVDESNKIILEEIAWSIYASACCLRGQQLFEPYLEQIIDKPKQGITSFIYNKLGFGNLK